MNGAYFWLSACYRGQEQEGDPMADEQQDEALHAAAAMTEALVRRTAEKAALTQAGAVLLKRAGPLSVLKLWAARVCLREAGKT
jgi:hypothetical protein